ncbi:MAG: LamG-like jellyroll fold domain-containing protein [Ginsengibacter sp.]
MKIFLPICLFLVSFFSSFSQVKLDSGLVAYYPFNGNANDASGNGNNAIFNNATLTSDHFGNLNSAYYFNGVDNYIQIPNAPGLNPPGKMSLCVFVKPMGFYRGPCHGNSILMKGDMDFLPGNYVMRFDDNAYTSQNNCNTSVVDTIHQNFYSNNAQTPPPGYTPYINKDQWYCLVYTYDGTNGNFYVDGILKGTESTPGTSFINSYDLFFGKLNSSSFPYWFNGVMDEVRIYNRAINAQEVFSLCPSTVLPVTLTSFEANIIDKQIKLNWNIENEDGIRNFTVQRSFTGHSDFTPLGTIIAGNIHAYSFVDNTAAANQDYYYRLSILENDGELNYSPIKTAKIIAKNQHIVVYPNPSRGTAVVKINGYTGNAKFTVINSVGQIIMQRSTIVIDNNPFPLTLSEQSKGIYWLKVETNNEQYVEKIMIF